MKNSLGTLPLQSLVAAALLFGATVPVAAQQDVMRDVYRFQGSALDVAVATETGGRIRLIRGQRSRVEVAGRAPDGFTSAALGGEGVRRLTLTALAEGPVDFVVSVPEDVRVRVVWEGTNRSELFGPLAASATFSWDAIAERPSIETFGAAAPARSRTASAVAAPRIIDIRSAHRLGRLSVRVGEETFSFSTSQHIDERRNGDALLFDAPQNGDVAIELPAGQSMTLRLDGVDAIVIDGRDVRVLCESVLSQSLPGGRQWLTLTPVPGDGCRGTQPRRAAPRPARSVEADDATRLTETRSPCAAMAGRGFDLSAAVALSSASARSAPRSSYAPCAACSSPCPGSRPSLPRSPRTTCLRARAS